MSEEWGPWIEHDGKGCPRGQYAQWIWCNGKVREGVAGTRRVDVFSGAILGPARGDRSNAWLWGANPPVRVIRYRIRKPRALIELRDMIADLPTPAEQVGP